MNYMNKTVTVLLLLFVIASTCFAGGGNRTGTGGAAQLLIPVGSRGIALSGSNIATTSDIEAIYWNPAGLARAEYGTNVTFSHMNYIADIGVEYGAISSNIEGLGALAFDIKSISIGDILVTTAQDPDGTGKTFNPSFITAGLTFSKGLTDRISVGTTVNLVTETLGDVSAAGVAFNIGLMYDRLGDIDGLSFGIAMKNIGPSMRYGGSGLDYAATATGFNRGPTQFKVESAAFELPSTFELGFGYKAYADNINNVSVSGSFQNNNFSGDEYRVGAEYSYQKMFFVRAGYDSSPKSQSEDFIYGFSAGAGINYAVQGLGVEINYAFRDVKYFGGNHVFEIKLGF